MRVVVLSGAGDHFCAGGDLKEMQVQVKRSRDERIADATELARLLAELDRFPRPIIGRINGSAFGGGLGLISICDIAIGVTTARYCLTEVRLGLVPATISPYVVAKLGVPHARRRDAQRHRHGRSRGGALGVIGRGRRVVGARRGRRPRDSGLPALRPGAVADCKRLIEFVSTHGTEENIPYTANQLADRWESAELAERDRGLFAKAQARLEYRLAILDAKSAQGDF